MKNSVEKKNLDNPEKFLLEMSMYQDQLLQTYRLIFISSQTILISIALLLLTSDKESILSLFFYLMLSGIGCILIVYWRNITENRELDVSYCHMQLLKTENNDPTLSSKHWTSFKDWQKKTMEAKRCELNRYCPSILSSRTREKMHGLPFWFLGIWILGFIIGLISFLNNQFNLF